MRKVSYNVAYYSDYHCKAEKDEVESCILNTNENDVLDYGQSDEGLCFVIQRYGGCVFKFLYFLVTF